MSANLNAKGKTQNMDLNLFKQYTQSSSTPGAEKLNAEIVILRKQITN